MIDLNNPAHIIIVCLVFLGWTGLGEMSRYFHNYNKENGTEIFFPIVVYWVLNAFIAIFMLVCIAEIVWKQI